MAEGTHEVKFVYKSTAAVVGIIISLLVLAGLLCSVVVVFIQRKVVRWSMCAANWVCIVVLFVLWLQSTEGKESLNTQYTWSSSQPLPTLNIAFAKETRASSIHLGQMPYYHYAGRAVDGDRGGRGWHARPRIASPFWQVDLNTSQKVQRLRMIRVSGNVATARRPLHVQTSLDGKIFRTYKLISSRPRTVAAGWEIDLDGVKTRFIRLWAPGSGGFGIAEVEVY